MVEPCSNSTMITSPNKQSVILLGCKENPESLYELIKTNGVFSWKKMSQKLTYGRYSTIAFLIPETFVSCNDSKSTTITSTARSISQTDISISESASFNLYIWLSLSGCVLIGLLITSMIHRKNIKTYFLTDEQLSLFWTQNDRYDSEVIMEELPNFHKSVVIKGYFIGIYTR